ncbi:erythromycin esterase family protein [Amycolatopsis sp. 195334CR]|uniref:erythromycin esterase family protein n=1 Tax=Amycolatopsis sp. 195334CR TaxID=2814588 RepID=UPI001A9029B7|nr:erythromycin esterase family protein [Amycolatopsis sp. 195334CR]MBN6034588.1 erythromycin esterase family protein [Amycolatopsis sp. 195334CR]
MSQDIRDFVSDSVDIVAYGEPTHQEPAFAGVRNELFAQLVSARGFRSIVLETDRVAALAVNDYVFSGTGDFDEVMRAGFTHGFGELKYNRELVGWMRSYNSERSPADRLTFHGYDTPMETMSAPSPRTYLEHARDYLGLSWDIASVAGDDDRWSRTESVMNYADSPGLTPDAVQLRVLADDMMVRLHASASSLIAAGSLAAWRRAYVFLTAGIALLRYHAQCAQPVDPMDTRVSALGGTRDALMAENLLNIRTFERSRGGTLVFSHNRHLQRVESVLDMWDMKLSWSSAGAIVSSISDETYTFIAGSLGASAAISLAAPPAGTYEAALPTSSWTLLPAASVPSATTRTDPTPMQGYFPLDPDTLSDAETILHIP